jgi:hypothetical protein
MHEPLSSTDIAASDARDALARIAVIEKRLKLILQVLQDGGPENPEELQEVWDECEPKPIPLPPIDYEQLAKNFPHLYPPIRKLGDGL